MRHVVLVTPPAVERAGKAWEMMDPGAVIVCADHEQAVLWADVAPAELRAHAITGLARTAALLKEGRVGVVAGSPADVGALVTRSALKHDTLETIVIAWPESFSAELDTLLGEAPEARRVILSWDPHIRECGAARGVASHAPAGPLLAPLQARRLRSHEQQGEVARRSGLIIGHG